MPVRSALAVVTPRRTPARPGAEPLAGRLRRGRRRAAGRAHRLLVDRRARCAHRARLRVPLGARPDRRDAAGAHARGRAGAGRSRPCRGGADPAAADGRGALPALEVPRDLDARPRRRDRRARHGARARLHGRPGVPQAGLEGPRPRPDRRLPGGQVPGHDLFTRIPRPATSRGAPRSSATTARGTTSRASRSSRTTAPTSAARCSRTGCSTRPTRSTSRTSR